MKQVVLTIEQTNQVLTYLGKQPCGDVYGLVTMLQGAVQDAPETPTYINGTSAITTDEVSSMAN